MEKWMYEKYLKGMGIALKVKRSLYKGKSNFQEVRVLETEECGRLLTIDGMIMLSERDEFIYHEMITHIPMFVHPRPEKVLVIGGGDGGTVRELLKHRLLKNITLVEIDALVLEVARKYLPRLSRSLNDKRLNIVIEDGSAYVRKCHKFYDLIILDSSDPVGPAKKLFDPSFFENIFSCLNNDGILVLQSESPFVHQKIIKKIYGDLRNIFPLVKLYTAPIPTYPAGLWSFTFASKKYHPVNDFQKKRYIREKLSTLYYNEEIHLACFMLPSFLKKCLQ